MALDMTSPRTRTRPRAEQQGTVSHMIPRRRTITCTRTVGTYTCRGGLALDDDDRGQGAATVLTCINCGERYDYSAATRTLRVQRRAPTERERASAQRSDAGTTRRRVVVEPYLVTEAL